MKQWLDMNPRRSSLALLLLTLAYLPLALAAEFTSLGDSWLEDEPEFLPVDQAFVLSTEVADDGALADAALLVVDHPMHEVHITGA